MFTAEATGTQPLSYQWEWKQKKKWGRSGKWQPCDAEWCDGAMLIICKVEKSHTGSYRCVVSNDIGSQTSNPANFSVGKHCKIIFTARVNSVSYINILCFLSSMYIAEPPKITTPAKLGGKSSKLT